MNCRQVLNLRSQFFDTLEQCAAGAPYANERPGFDGCATSLGS